MILKIDNDKFVDVDQTPKQSLQALKDQLSQQQVLLQALKDEPMALVRQRGADDAEAKRKQEIEDTKVGIDDLKAKIAEVKILLGVN